MKSVVVLLGLLERCALYPAQEWIDAFKECSVATSQWRLIIPTVDSGTVLLNIDELDDIVIYFYHYAVIRP